MGFYIVLNVFVYSLPPLNSCLNPFIYLASNSQFRVALKDLWYRATKKPRSNIIFPEDSVGNDSARRSTTHNSLHANKYIQEPEIPLVNNFQDHAIDSTRRDSILTHRKSDFKMEGKTIAHGHSEGGRKISLMTSRKSVTFEENNASGKESNQGHEEVPKN